MIKVRDIAFVEYQVPDLDKQEAFLTDFGLVVSERRGDTLFARGAGPAPYLYVARKGEPGFQAAAFTAQSRDDLAKLEGHPDAITGIEALDRPGGGEAISLRMPDGFVVKAVHGIAPAESLPVRDPLTVNHAQAKSRRGSFQRPEHEPARVFRLGHCVFKVADEARARQWLKDTLGLLESDLLHAPEDPNAAIGTFLRCDRGEEWTDHHTVLVLEDKEHQKIHHVSYEVQDPDAVFIGHQWLAARGWKHEWGVGRHVLGSQVFDYWRDPWGHMMEHYADGDLLTAEWKPGVYPATPDNLAQWGPELTPTFFD